MKWCSVVETVEVPQQVRDAYKYPRIQPPHIWVSTQNNGKQGLKEIFAPHVTAAWLTIAKTLGAAPISLAQ